jgi:hypothetical protein
MKDEEDGGRDGSGDAAAAKLDVGRSLSLGHFGPPPSHFIAPLNRTTPMEGQTLCWTDIPVIDLARAIKFYSAMLDAPVTDESQPGFEFALLPHDDNASGCLTVSSDNQPSRVGPLIYLSVEGRLDAAIAAVSARGGEVMQAKHQIGTYGYRAVVVDSEGNRIALHSTTA